MMFDHVTILVNLSHACVPNEGSEAGLGKGKEGKSGVWGILIGTGTKQRLFAGKADVYELWFGS